MLPLIAIYTVLTCLIVIVGCTIGNGHFWGYFPGKWWAQFIVRVLMLPVKVEGRENLEDSSFRDVTSFSSSSLLRSLISFTFILI